MTRVLAAFSPAAGLPRVYLMRMVDALASATATYAIPLLVLVTTGSTALTGIAFLLEWLPRLTAITIAGSLVDQWGAGRIFKLANLVRTAVVALVGVLLSAMPGSGPTTVCVVLAFGAVAGLLAETSFVAVEVLGTQEGRAPGRAAHRVQSVQTGIDQGAQLVGPLLGGLLLLAGPVVLLSVVALLTVTAVVATSGPDSVTAPRPVAGSLRGGWATVRRTGALLWLVGGLAASNLATGVLQAAAPITVVTHFQHSTAVVGAVWSAAAVASLIAVWASRRAIDRCGIWPTGAVAAAVATAACLASALAPTLPAYTVAVALVMAGEGVLTVVLRTMRARLIPVDAFGSTLAVTIVLVLVPLPVAGALVATVPATGLPHLLLGCALLQCLALAACFTGLRRHRSDGEPSAPHRPALQPADAA